MTVPPAPAHSPAAPAAVTLQLPISDARALDALLVQLGGLERELAHARETAARRGDEASEERVLDLECEHRCQAERLAAMMAARIASTVHRALRGVAP